MSFVDGVVKFDMTLTVFIAVLLLMIGKWVVSKAAFLRKYCIPASIVGGLPVAFILMFVRLSGVAQFSFDVTLQSFFMNLFFTASGFAASVSLFKKAGKLMAYFVFLAALLAVLQNILSIAIAIPMGMNPVTALMTGSVALTGGLGTAGSFAGMAESLGGGDSSLAVGLAAATFGMIGGAIIGGPTADRLIRKKKLYDPNEKVEELDISGEEVAEAKASNMPKAFNLIVIALGIGSLLNLLLKLIAPDFVLPPHVMGLVAGAAIRLIMEGPLHRHVPEPEIDILGNIFLGVFISMAVYTLELDKLASLALPLIVILTLQLVFMWLFIQWPTFRMMGKNYDSAIISAGFIGFGLGSTPVSMAAMDSVCSKYRHSKMAYFIVPIVGGFLSNLTNAVVITWFMNFFGTPV